MSDGIKRFNSRRPPVTFEVDDEKFTAAGSVPADLMKDLMAQAEKLKAADDFESQYEAIKVIVESVLEPDSLAAFSSRLDRTNLTNPVDFEALADISTWLVSEVYSRRPTPSPSPSQVSASPDGTPSTDGPPPEVSILSTSPGTGT